MTRFCLLLLALLCLGADIAFGGSEPPPTLAALVETEAPESVSDDEESGFAGEKRRSAMRAAALAFGSQGGLARRGWEIARMLERHGPKLSTVYRFRDLMLRYHGFTVMPPVLAKTGRAFRLERSGTQAARAERILRIVEPERIVSAAPALAGLSGAGVARGRARRPRSCSPATRRRPVALAALAAQGLERRALRSPTTSSRPTWNGSIGCSRVWCCGAGRNLERMVSAPSLESERARP